MTAENTIAGKGWQFLSRRERPLDSEPNVSVAS